jgi:hypothetical protein
MKAEVIETKRKPSLWTVKAGGRYQASFAGPTAKDNAIKYAAKRFAEFIVVERPTPKREQARFDAWAGLSKPK